ncbi:hypothetical protein ACHAXR_013240 [Thalassiosira sp. AJA248-18]
MKSESGSGDDDAWRKYQVRGNRQDRGNGLEQQQQQQQAQHQAQQQHQEQHQQPQQQYQQQQQQQQYEQPPPPPELQQQGNGGDKSWLKYKVGGDSVKNRNSNAEQQGGSSRRGSISRRGSSKMFGREPRNKLLSARESLRSVKQMPCTDQFGDPGIYTGCVNEEGRPDGKGSMKYENGVFYEGTWTDGCQDSKAASQYGRIRGGFTSWSGKGKQSTKAGATLPWNARKNDVHDPSDKTNVRGMEWTDLNGESGRYTGEVTPERLPHGNGVMKYNYGLIAEGEWINGVLKEGPQDRMISAAASMGAGGMSVGPSGMSVGPSGMSVGMGMSVGGPAASVMSRGFAMPMAPMPMMQPIPMQYGAMNPMMGAPTNASQHAMISHQNAMMRNMYGGGGSVYGGTPSMMGGMQPMQMQMPMQMMQPQQPVPQQPDKPPVKEIKIDM